jgi:hypothetical protein
VSTSPRTSPLSGSSSHSSHPHHQSLGPDRNVLAEFLEIWDRAGARAQISMTQGRMLFSVHAQLRPTRSNDCIQFVAVRPKVLPAHLSTVCGIQRSVTMLNPSSIFWWGLLISSAPSHLRRRPVPPSPGFIRDSCFRPNPYSAATRGCRS